MLCATLWLLASPDVVAAQHVLDHHALSRTFTVWLTTVAQHAPGVPDAAAAQAATFDERTLRAVSRELDALDKAIARASTHRPFRPRATAANGALLSSAETMALLGAASSDGAPLDCPACGADDGSKVRVSLSRLVRRAVLLHTDVAVFLRNGRVEASPAAALDDRGSVAVLDGQHRGYGERWPHWIVARQLFARRLHDPADADDARQWYVAAAAHMYATGQLVDLLPHLQEGARAFPEDPGVAFYDGLLQARIASPALQGAMRQASLPTGRRSGVSDSRVHLERARASFRRTLAEAPGMTEARIRLGHVLLELGHPQEAATQLQQALVHETEPSRRYLAELFLGDALAATDSHAGAQAAYERAADLVPHAPSPWMALSRLARAQGRPQEAAALLERVLDAAPGARRVGDPWWTYYQRDFTTPDRLLDAWRTHAPVRTDTP